MDISTDDKFKVLYHLRLAKDTLRHSTHSTIQGDFNKATIIDYIDALLNDVKRLNIWR